MAAIISISSDEEESDNLERPKKRCKIISVINLDDEEEKNIHKRDDGFVKSCNITKPIVTNNNEEPVLEKEAHPDITIESDDDQDEGNLVINDIIMNDDLKDTEKANRTVELKEDSLKGDSNIQTDPLQSLHKFTKFQSFIEMCLSKIDSANVKSTFLSKIPLCKKYLDKTDTTYLESKAFNSFLKEKMECCKASSLAAISSFKDVYQHLKFYNGNETELSEKHQVIIEKLEGALKKVQKMITKLEEAEVDFDEEDDSSYIKMQRYRERAVKIFEKICKYRKENLTGVSYLYNRLDFNGSNYTEFNHAINRRYKNNTAFPTYYDVERCLRKVMMEKNMDLSDATFKSEARECFKGLGNLLQKRRKIDLLDIHSSYLKNDDPAANDVELQAKLNATYKEAKSKTDEICEKYVKLQESGVNPAVSSSSDDSVLESSDDEKE